MTSDWPEVDVEEELSIEPFDEASLRAFTRRILATVWKLEQKALRLSVHYCGDPAMCDMHEQWLGDPSSTDVMSFPLGESEFAAEGELVVCIDHARSQAVEHGNPFVNELALYVVHGALHLLGHDDHDAEDLAVMKKSEARVLEELGLEVQGRHERA